MGMPDFTREEIEEVVKASQKLQRAELRDIDLSGANLRRADLFGANLSNANLSGADLRYTTLNRADLSQVKYAPSTLFPEGFDPEEAGMVLVE